jgi:hypothetical protein
MASLLRQIEDVKKRRREAWELWAKIVSGLVTSLVAIGSVIVSLSAGVETISRSVARSPRRRLGARWQTPSVR